MLCVFVLLGVNQDQDLIQEDQNHNQILNNHEEVCVPNRFFCVSSVNIYNTKKVKPSYGGDDPNISSTTEFNCLCGR